MDGSYVFVLKERFSSTRDEQSPWWLVDLGSSVLVTEVVTYFRKSGAKSRLYKLQIRIGDHQDKTGIPGSQCGSAITVLSESKRHVRCDIPRVGRYVTIQHIGNGKLVLTEVKVPRTSKFLTSSTCIQCAVCKFKMLLLFFVLFCFLFGSFWSKLFHICSDHLF